MFKFSHLLPIIAFFAILIGFTSCSSNTGTHGEVDFDRSAMLQNYGNNLILPAYENLKDKVDNLDSSAKTFANASTLENLEALQEDLKEARLAWQDASIFQFGPAEMQTLRGSVNKYPTDTSQVNSNIESGDYNLGTIENQDAVGFPAIGFLLHGTSESNQEILAQYTTDSEAGNRTNYLLDNVSFVKEKIDDVVNEWKSDGGDYIGEFLSEENAGTDAGSSLGMLVNAMVLHYERFLRDGKIGIPSGVRSAGVPRPTATEAFYAGYSLELAVANTKAVQRLFLGTSLNGSDGSGLEENLNALDANELSNEIDTKLEEALAALQELQDPLSEQIKNNNDPVNEAFQALQQPVSLLKADMSSVLGITITFADNDGD